MRKLILSAVAAAATAGLASPRMTIPKMGRAPDIDGVLSEGEWTMAGMYNRFVRR